MSNKKSKMPHLPGKDYHMEESTPIQAIPAVLKSFLHFDWKAAGIVITIVWATFWLYSDKHNSTLYVSKEAYHTDQKVLKESLTELKEGQAKILDHLLAAKTENARVERKKKEVEVYHIP